MERKPDFVGYATKIDIKCSDGRTIKKDAFKHNDGEEVPLFWQHGHNSIENLLGHALLKNVEDGVLAHGFFNETEAGKAAKIAVQNGDVTSLSIYANQLRQKNGDVEHGNIREVSLVLAGANPGAQIDPVSVRHSDGFVDELEDEAIIHTGLDLMHEEESDEDETDEGETLQDVYDSLSEKQKNVVEHMLAEAIKYTPSAEHGEDEGESLTHQEGSDMSRNVFEGQNGAAQTTKQKPLTPEQMKTIMHSADKLDSLRDALLMHAEEYGIQDIEVLFPDAKALENKPELIARQTEWVNDVVGGAKHVPFSRVKTLWADVTHEEARAKGYIKGNVKKDEFFKVKSRKTGPTTIYKKQKLDRDDILDITSFDVVAWLKAEMLFMLKEEIGRAVLLGDGRDVEDDDKVDEESIRPIVTDHELFNTTINVNVDDADSSAQEIIDAILVNRKYYKGTGRPTLFTTEDYLTSMMLLKDGIGRYMYNTESELAARLRVDKIVTVEAMEDTEDLIGVMVNMRDYTIGADNGGNTTFFDDFDLKVNQYHYLYETRISGALTKIKAAVTIRKVSGTKLLVKPNKPAVANNVVTVPTQTGVVYKNADTNATLTTAAPVTLTAAAPVLNVVAVPAGTHYFADNVSDEWTFEYRA